MARNPRNGSVWKWLFAIVLLAASLATAAVAGEYIGLWSVSRPLLNWATTIPAFQPHVQMYRVGRGDWQEWERRQEEQAQWEEDLKREARRLRDEWARLEAERKALEQRAEALRREEARIAARLEELEGAQRRADNLDRLREIYQAMRPEDAAAVAESLDDALLVELLETMETAQAARLLAELDPERAARLTRLVRQGQ